MFFKDFRSLNKQELQFAKQLNIRRGLLCVIRNHLIKLYSLSYKNNIKLTNIKQLFNLDIYKLKQIIDFYKQHQLINFFISP